MTKHTRRKKVNKQKSPTIVSPSTKTPESAPLPSGVAKLRPDRTMVTSKEIFIAAPVESCFKILASQLEEPPHWDPIIVNTQPVSNVRGRIGATSQVTLNLGGRKLESLATICRYYPKRGISWVFTTRPRLREDWRLEQKPGGTMVALLLAYEVPGWGIGRLLYKIRHWKKVEQDVDKMLTQLKEAVESISHDQKAIGKRRL